jgi:4-amino-4-deoxy-L-arabinose transferase-like glycosyltransferase
VAALAVRLSVPYRPHVEGDERIYLALVENIDAGRGYTLQGHPLLEEPGTDRVQYGQKLFFHPPGGIALFWVGKHLVGERGFLAVQLFSWALFFWTMMGLTRRAAEEFGTVEAVLAAGLAGFAPILLHVTAHYWLDGPLLACATLAVLLYVVAVERGSIGWALAAGLTLGYAGLIKPTAVLIVPGAAVFVRAIAVNRGWKPRRDHALVALGAAGAVFSIWLAWRWTVLGTPFPGWAGRPTGNLATINPYVHFVTVIRGPWVYLRLLPETLPTLPVAFVFLLVFWKRLDLRRVSIALALWIGFIILVHVALGYLGFSKVLRYVILVSPATILLFVVQGASAWRAAKPNGEGWGLAGLAAVAFIYEIGQGIHTMAVSRDLIIPWPFGP